MKERRPKSSFVSFIAWSFIVISIYSAFMGVFQIFIFVGMQATGTLQPMLDTLNSPQMESAGAIRFAFDHMVSISLFSTFVSLLTLYASIALLRRREWARKLFQAFLLLIVVSSFGGFFYHFDPPQVDPEMAEIMGGGLYSESMGAIVNMTVYILSFLSIAAHSWIMWKLNKDKIKEEFY